MRTIQRLSVAAALSGALYAPIAVAANLPPVVIKGSHFFLESGAEFFIKGIAYQPDFTSGIAAGTEPTDFVDPLASEAGCKRDVPLLKELGVNTIRVYTVNATNNHDYCMGLLNDAGIYVIQDLSSPMKSIKRNSPEWTTDLFTSYASVVDTMSKYSNVLGFFAGNEVSNVRNNTNASAFVKAAVRDMKAYIKEKKYRTIGVGYATNDDAEIRDDLKDYFNCGDPAAAIDFWGYNIYSWCGDSSFTKSGYDQRTLEFANYSVPAFFAEYSCNTVRPRKFTEVGAIYGPQMTNVWSGGIMYMYFQETNDYGLVQITDGKASKLPDFSAFKSQLATVSPSFTSASAYTPTNTVAQDCPATGTAWGSSQTLPPAANAALCECMVSSLQCVADSSLDGTGISALFGTVCGLDAKACAGVSANSSTGVYGAYSACNGKQKLSYVVNQYYLNRNKASDACNFAGQAKTQSASSGGSTCSSMIQAAESASKATGTSSSAASGTATRNAALSLGAVPKFDTGFVHLALYIAVAGLTGASMILL